MIDAIRRFLSVRYNYVNQLNQHRAGGLLVLTSALALFVVVYWVVYLVPGLLAGIVPLPVAFIFLLVLPAVTILIYHFIQTGRLGVAIWLFVGGLYLGVLPFSLTPISRSLPVLLLVVAVAAGVLLNRRQFVVILILLLATLLLRANVQSQMTQANVIAPASTVLSDIGMMSFAIGLSAALLYAFSGSAQRLSQISTDDIHYFKTASTFTETESEESLLANALRVIQSDLGYSLGQLFLFETDGSLQRRVRLGIGQSDVTSSTLFNRGNVVVMSEVMNTRHRVTITARDEQPRRSHLVASAQRALIVPIMNAHQVLGALDVQMAYDHPLTTNQIEALEFLGKRLGEALSQARLIDDLRQSLREREDAAAYMRQQLVEMQGGNRRLLQSGWNQYLQSRGEIFGYDLPGRDSGVVAAADLPEEIRVALSQGDVMVQTRGDEQIINAPIIFRGEMLGAMAFAVPADRALSDDEIETVRTIASRLGVALENNRLLEQTQAQALRERKASEVANVLLTATSIESLMELAAENFNEALSAVNTHIYLEPGVVAEPPARGEPA